jgi:tetratricopeptide (TPR) repeat protein
MRRLSPPWSAPRAHFACWVNAAVSRALLHQAQFHSDQRHFAVAEGLTRSAAQLLAEEPECAEQGLLMCKLAHFFLNQGDLGRGRHYAERARDIGRRVRDRNIEAMGLLWLGHCDLSEGQLVEGMALHDEATAAATSGELDPYFSGYIYCNVINACRDRADWHRAVEWTERADRWCERESVGFFPGVCRVHRAEILRLRGSLGDAERDVMSGCEMLATASPSHSVMAFRELAEVRLRLGDLDGAEAACKSALLFGVEPQPAYARLRLERGDTDGALTSIDNALASQSIGYVQSHVHLLPTKISIAIAAGELAAARAALAQLDALAKALGTPAPAAAAASSNGELALAEDKSAVAINHLRRAVIGWVEEGVPYEAAQTRCLLATAYKREGDLEAAARELETALTSFLRLGARLDASRAQQQLTELSTPTSGGSRA